MNIAVVDPVGNTYAPFLNPDLQHNNLVFDKVIRQYKQDHGWIGKEENCKTNQRGTKDDRQ